MGFLKRLFGGETSRATGSTKGDDEGFFVYLQCEQCGDKLRLRVHKQYDLIRTDDGFVWHKTIIDSRCFRPSAAVVYFNRDYQLVSAEIEGVKLISQAQYDAPPDDSAVSQTTGDGGEAV